MNKHFKAIYLNILKYECKVSFKNNTFYLKYKYADGSVWQAKIENGKYYYSFGTPEREWRLSSLNE